MKLFILLLFSLCFFHNEAICQGSKTKVTDWQKIQRAKNDTNKVKLIFKCLENNNYSEDSSFSLLYQALAISKKVNYIQGACISSINICLQHGRYQISRDSAIYYCTQALSFAKRQSDPELVIESYFYLGIFSLEFYTNADRAIIYYDSALVIAARNNLFKRQVPLLVRKAESLVALKKYDLAKKTLQLSLSIQPATGEDSDMIFLPTLANLFMETGHYDSSIIIFNRVLSIVQKRKSMRWESYIHACLGRVYCKAGNIKMALAMANKGLEIALENKLVKEKLDNFDALYQIHKEAKTFDKALFYYEQKMHFTDSLNQSTLEGNTSRFEVQLRVEKSQNQNLLLKKENEVQAEKSKWQKITIGFILGGLLLVIVFSIFAVRRARIMKMQKQIIEEKQKEILDSIHYAKRIQTALLSSNNYIDKSLKRLQNKKS